jgi:hypothetical protein
MKKVSTAVAKQSGNFSQPKLAIGLDLGDCSSWYCPLDEATHDHPETRMTIFPCPPLGVTAPL